MQLDNNRPSEALAIKWDLVITELGPFSHRFIHLRICSIFFLHTLPLQSVFSLYKAAIQPIAVSTPVLCLNAA